jgi:Sulfatase-modifying factor enzyme 1
MKAIRRCSVVVWTTVWLAALSAGAGASKCPADSVKVGNVCVDLYEASVWQIDPIANPSLVKKVQQGKATLADLTGGGATQLDPQTGFAGVPQPQNFPPDGNWTPVQGSHPPSPGFYAVSLPGVLPSEFLTWFQANQACLLSGKRLLTNVEWQGAAAGTPDPGTDNGTSDCAVGHYGADPPAPFVKTGSRANCQSRWGVFDMVGNADEWVADWVDTGTGFAADWTNQTGIAGHDFSEVGGDGSVIVFSNGDVDASAQLPGAFFRGGDTIDGFTAGVFFVDALGLAGGFRSGFRCAR